MPILIERASERGGANPGWLDTKHSFSFNTYHNPDRMGFGALRVLNEDVIAPGTGFGAHEHDNMEIVTVVLEGALEHKDSAGHAGVIRAGDVQRMSAGSGVTHSEYNASKTASGHFLQLWIHTATPNVAPEYEQTHVDLDSSKNKNRLVPVVTGKNGAGPLRMHQDALVALSSLDAGKTITHRVNAAGKQRGVFVFVIEGHMRLGGEKGETLGLSDSAEITQTALVELTALKPSRVLLIDVPFNA